MKKILLAAALSLASASANAVLTADFSTLGSSSPASLGTDTTTLNGITATAYTFAGGSIGQTKSEVLWVRSAGDEHGLGICSSGEGSCSSTGNDNEISNNVNYEVLELVKDSNSLWSDIWVSSLDSGGTGIYDESGIVYWSTASLSGSDFSDASVLGSITFTKANIFGGGVEGSIWNWISGASGWDSSANYLYFAANTASPYSSSSVGNNDYYVYGASVTAVPEPETYAMLLAGLGVLGVAARRRKRKQTV